MSKLCSIVLFLSWREDCCIIEDICVSAGQWDSMEEYTCMIPRDTHDGAFYRAVLALHQDLFSLAQQVIIFLVGFPKPSLRWTRLYFCMERHAVLKQLAVTYELPNNLFSIDVLDLGDWAYLVFPETQQWIYVQIVVAQCCRVYKCLSHSLASLLLCLFSRQCTRVILAEVPFYKALLDKRHWWHKTHIRFFIGVLCTSVYCSSFSEVLIYIMYQNFSSNFSGSSDKS